MRRAILIATWIVALISAFFIVKVFRIGPVIYVVSEEHGWGIHSGDFLALIPLGLAFALTLLLRKTSKTE